MGDEDGEDEPKRPAFSPEDLLDTGLDPDKVYCTLRSCEEWDNCKKKYFKFVKVYCPKLWDR